MDDYKYKLSIIIPMYNAEKYIGICLDSILGSNLLKEEYEIVIVNDGSQDKSPEIAQNYAAKYSNVTYLTQENQGQSTARNYGIKTCQGEYVWCVDADDKLISEQLPKITEALDEYKNLDILAVQLQNVTEEGKYLDIECTQPLVEHNRIISGVEAVISGYIPSSICALIARRELFVENDVFFVKGITHQDVKYIKDDIYIIKSFQKLASSFKHENLMLYNVIYNQSQNVLFSLVYSLYKNKQTWRNMGINTAIVAELKKEKLYPIRGKFDSIKKTICARLFLNIPCVLE